MPALTIQPHGDNAWPELREQRERGELREAELVGVSALPGGMQSGAPSVALRIELPDGSTAIAQTSLRLFLSAADAFRAAHGDPR